MTNKNIKFYLNCELSGEFTEEIHDELLSSLNHHILGFCEFNKLNPINIDVVSSENIKNLNSEWSRLKEVKLIDNFHQDEKIDSFECSNCEDEFYNTTPFVKYTDVETIILCRDCYEEYKNTYGDEFEK